MRDFMKVASKFRNRILIGIVIIIVIGIIGAAIIVSKKSNNEETLQEEIVSLNVECHHAQSEALHLFDEFWEWKLLQYPEDATLIGIHKYDDILTDVSAEHFQKKFEDVSAFLKRSQKLLPCLEGNTLLDLRILISQLTLFRDGHRFSGYFFPNNILSNLKTSLERVFGEMPLRESRDYDVMLSRMKKIPQKVDQLINLFRNGMGLGLKYHQLSINGLNETLKEFVSDNAEDSFFYRFFSNIPRHGSVTSQQIESFQQRAKEIINKKISPAFQKYVDFLNNEYETREEIGITSIKPNGMEMYKQLIWAYTSSTMTPQEIHEVGLKEVEKIEAAMKEILKEMGHGNISLNEFSKQIKENDMNYYNSPEKLLSGYRVLVEKARTKLTTYFKSIPKAELKVKETSSKPMAHYTTPSLDGSSPGVFHVPIKYLKAVPKCFMPALTLHEGVPGHHLQTSLLMESEAPNFRKVGLGEGLNMQPSGFSFPVVYVEGWALYAESLGIEMGIYDDPLDRYGFYSSEMYRACRLVVDTGIHALNWTREQAIDYMMTYLLSSRKAVEIEVDRYITWPGQALSYKIGQLKIIELRDKASDKIGDHFDIREFHDVVLSIPSSLHILEKVVNDWIEMKYKNIS